MSRTDLALKRQARSLMRQRGVSYADAQRVVSRMDRMSPSEPLGEPEKGVWIGPHAVMSEMLPFIARQESSRMLVICPARAMVAVEQALATNGATEPIVSVRSGRWSEVPARGTVLLSQSTLSHNDPRIVKALSDWQPEVLILPFAQDVTAASKRQRGVSRLSRAAGRTFAGVDYFGALRPCQVHTLLSLTGHGKAIFPEGFARTHLESFVAFGRVEVGWRADRTDDLQAALLKHVLVNEPEEWPWDAVQRKGEPRP